MRRVETKNDGPPVDLRSDNLTYDQDNAIVTASGRVEVKYEDRVLLADKVVYNQNTDVVMATGNVALLDPAGETLLADEIEITGDLKDGVLRNIGLILADRSRVAGAGARRSDGLVTELSKGVYSPCNLCAEDPNSAPLWQIKAVKVTHDKRTKTIEYRDAILEVAGIPVFYTPFFAHPDPSVKRESGFLTPSIGNSSDLGTVISVPYFQVLSDSADFTFTPTFTEEEGFLGAAEFRKRFTFGQLDVAGSFVNDDDGENRGHIAAEGTFDINDQFRAGFDVNRTTDDTFLRIFGFESPAILQSEVFLEGFFDRSFLSVNAFSFQDLRPISDLIDAPNVFPEINYQYISDPNIFGGVVNVDANIAVLARREVGNDTRRFSLRPTWTRRFLDEGTGSNLTFSTGIFADLFNVTALPQPDGTVFNGTEGRLFPFASLDWRLPFIKTSGDGKISQTIEPVLELIAAPNGGNRPIIPNEDSQEFEFDDTNVFGVNRFGGLDLVEGGLRANFGLKYGIFDDTGKNATFFIGQVFRVQDDDTFAEGSGLETRFSDLVANARIDLGFLDLTYRTLFDREDVDFARNEVRASFGVPAFRVTTNYLFFEAAEDSEFDDREDVTVNVSSQLTKRWKTRFRAVQDIDADELRSLLLELTFENECCRASTRLSRTFFVDRDVEPTDAITFNILLKTLGGFGTDG